MISFLRYFLLLHYISPVHCTFHEMYTFVLLSMIVHSLHDCIVLFLIVQFFSCWHDTFRTSVHDCSDFSSIFQDCNYMFLIMVTSTFHDCNVLFMIGSVLFNTAQYFS